jgi:predicted transcriptional regulator
MLSSYKTPHELRSELNVTDKVVENAIRYLSDLGLIRRRRYQSGKSGVAYAYAACDSSETYSFEEKVARAKSASPWVTGRCDVAASWVPRQESV